MLESRTRGWVLIESANLRVRANIDAERAADLTRRYQRMRDAIAEYELPCAFDRLTAPLEVTLAQQSNEPSTFRPSRSALLGLRPQIVLTSAKGRESVRVFTHEMAHQLVAACFPTAPVWFNEGLASFYETTRLEGDELTLGYPPYVFLESTDWAAQPIIERELDGERVLVLSHALAPSVEELRSMDRSEFYAIDWSENVAHYAGAWTLVHLLRFGEPSYYAPFNRYQRALHAGQDEPAAWRENFGDLRVESRYQRYLTENYTARARKVNTAEPPDLSVVELSRGETALLLAELEPWNEPRGAERAERFIGMALEEPATRTRATVLRAALLRQQKRQGEAASTLEAALAEHPTDADLLSALLGVYLGSTSLDASTGPMLAGWLANLERYATRSNHFAIAAGWELRLHGDPAKALSLAERAIELDGTSMLAHWIAGDAYRSLGQPRRALQAYQAALSLSRHLVDENRENLETQIVALRSMLRD